MQQQKQQREEGEQFGGGYNENANDDADPDSCEWRDDDPWNVRKTIDGGGGNGMTSEEMLEKIHYYYRSYGVDAKAWYMYRPGHNIEYEQR